MKKVTLGLLLAASTMALVGCGKKADEKKDIGRVRAEAEKMSATQLNDMATKYKDAIMAKKADVEKMAARLKEIPVAELLGEKAKQIKAEIDKLNGSISALKERFDVYYNKLKEKGGDVTALKI